MRVDGGSYDFVWGLKYNLVFQVIWIYAVIRDDEILRCLCAWLCGFTTSSMTGAGLRILISIHESSRSRVKCMWYESVEVWYVKNEYWILTDTWWFENLCDTWWFENLCDTWWFENLCDAWWFKNLCWFEKLYET